MRPMDVASAHPWKNGRYSGSAIQSMGIFILSLFFTLISQQRVWADVPLIGQLRNLMPDAVISAYPAAPPYQAMYEIHLPQPLDHDNPGGETFTQRIHLYHLDTNRPMVIETYGYNLYPREKELSTLINGNYLAVEHRFFGSSTPADKQWEFLNIHQIVRDYHRITTLLKSIYQQKWVCTGMSKGGQTALAYRRHFPHDVAVTVPYVAPMNLNREDHRLDRFLETIGTDTCRDRMRDFQRMALERRTELLPLMVEYAQTYNRTFSIGIETAFEYAVLEYTFSFWQYGDGDCTVIPRRGASAREIFNHLYSVSGFYTYSDQGIEAYEPLFYQNMREWGYYGFITYYLRDLLEAVPDPDNAIFAPSGVDITYQRHVLQDILHWLDHEGDNIIYINGARDIWSASAVEPSGKTNAVRLDVEDGNHFCMIRDLSGDQKKTLLRQLEKWLDIRIDSQFAKAVRRDHVVPVEEQTSATPENRQGFYTPFLNP